jgi:general stress protein 26
VSEVAGTCIAPRLRMGQSKHSDDDEKKAQQNFFELLKKFDTAMLVTHSGKSAPLHARPMAVAETSEDGSVWFITGQDTPKVDEIQHDSELVATFQHERQFLSVSGRAELHHDRARIHKVWKESFRAWFNGKDDPNIVLIRLNPSSAEYWDNTGLKGLKFALKVAAAYVTGQELRGSGDVNTHAKVPL